jgi:hypothetical protein
VEKIDIIESPWGNSMMPDTMRDVSNHLQYSLRAKIALEILTGTREESIGEEISGEERRGEARRGEERRGEARRGEARRGEARRGEAQRGEERRGEASRGEERRGDASEGEQRRGYIGRAGRQGRAARQGRARRQGDKETGRGCRQAGQAGKARIAGVQGRLAGKSGRAEHAGKPKIQPFCVLRPCRMLRKNSENIPGRSILVRRMISASGM